MVLRKEPHTLAHISAQSLVKSLVHDWLRPIYFMQPDRQCNDALNKVIITEYIPHFVLEKIFDLLLKTCIKTQMMTESVFILGSLLSCIFIPSLKVLDLSFLNLKTIVHKPKLIGCSIKFAFIKEIPLMNNLVRLNLQSGETLTICGDTILKLVGQYCPKLRYLDVSGSDLVSDDGLQFLIPTKNGTGCSLLNEIIIFKCRVTPMGVASLMKGLPELEHIDYEELCNSFPSVSSEGVKTKINKITMFHELTLFHVYPIVMTCPELKVLKVCMPDSDVFALKYFKKLDDLEIIYSSGNIYSSPDIITQDYLEFAGHKLISLSIKCDSLCTGYLEFICTVCPNLERLSINCCTFFVTDESDPDESYLPNLKSFSITVGDSAYDQTCDIPYHVFHSVLKTTCSLEKLVIQMRNNQLNDKFMQVLLKSINVDKLKILMVCGRTVNKIPSTIKLKMETFELIVNSCPQLVELGDILEWDLSLEEIYFVSMRLQGENCALKLLVSIANNGY